MVTTPNIPPAEAADRLTARERCVLKLIGQGLADREIAETISRSLGGVRYHVREIKAELGVSRREVLVRFAVRAKLVPV